MAPGSGNVEKIDGGRIASAETKPHGEGYGRGQDRLAGFPELHVLPSSQASVKKAEAALAAKLSGEIMPIHIVKVSKTLCY
jgi:hypothetical protein